MILQNINHRQKEQGSVIYWVIAIIIALVVTAVTAFIMLNGASKNTSTAESLKNAQSAQNYAQIFAADFLKYPGSVADFSKGKTTQLPTKIIIQGSDPTESNGLTTLGYDYVGTSPDMATGGRFRYWDYSTNKVSTNFLYVGTATSKSTFNSIK
ncbi:MAG: hypothetical protein WCH58_00335 [Candidatus Saccharibacteria bacterium]